MGYKPAVYRMLDSLFGSRFQELPGAEIIKETEKAYLILYCDQERWIPKQFVKIKEDRIELESWIMKKKFI